jgi:hypothetical protein
MAVVTVTATEAARAPAVALALWRGKAADRTATKVEAATEAAAALAATGAVAEAVAAQQQQWCHGGGGGNRRGGRGNGGTSSGGRDRDCSSNKDSRDNKGSGNNKGSRDNRGSSGNISLMFFHKFIPYVASYVNPIQTGFLMTFRKSYGRTGIVFPVKKHHRSRESEGFLHLTEITNLGVGKAM